MCVCVCVSLSLSLSHSTLRQFFGFVSVFVAACLGKCCTLLYTVVVSIFVASTVVVATTVGGALALKT